MPSPDFLYSRRQLRRSRLQDVLGLTRGAVDIRLHRNRLLEQLAAAADNPTPSFDTLSERTVDTVVSLALAEIDESAIDALIVVLLCVRVLAADGQFARLRLLAERLRSLSGRLVVEKPYMASAVEAFALALQARDRAAELLLEERLGISPTLRLGTVALGRSQIDDILMAATLQKLLREQDYAFAARAREAALATQNGILFTYLESIVSWREAVSKARPSVVLTKADHTFALDRVQDYLANRGIHVLYPPQITAIQEGATLDRDHVVSLPTSSGKTLIAEFRIVASLTRHPGTRAIYVAPYRMLARQVERSFRPGLARLGITVKDLGSGFDTSFLPNQIELPDVAICTPERLDALLRISGENTSAGIKAAMLFESTSVVVVDELQLIGRPGRGPRFEMILARLRSKYPAASILGLCAASAKADDLAQWLAGSDAIAGASRPTGTLEIVWETGGVLRQRVEPRPTAVAKIPRSRPLDDAADLILRLNARYRPVLVVEPTRPLAESLANKIAQLGPAIAAEWRSSLDPSELELLNIAVQEIRELLGGDHPLARLMENGIAFHHAGVPMHALIQIEQLAEMGILRVVSATTTVAEGADLPFRVVILPHLTFPGRSRRLERDLYLNIIGRAGRANVSVEGIVFVFDSSAPTLRNLVRDTLWSPAQSDTISGYIAQLDKSPRTLDDWTSYYDIQSQIMGWLGDGNSYVEDQPRVLAEKTLSWQQSTSAQRDSIVKLFSRAFDDLEARGYALAASPFQLTSRGRYARLTGLSAPTIARLERAIERGKGGWLQDLLNVRFLTPEIATHVARLLFESLEVAEKSLWLRRAAGGEDAKFELLARLADRSDVSFYDAPEYEVDISLVTSWMLGASYADIGNAAPVYPRANSLFGGVDESKRTSDATEYIGSLTYPASWVWSGVRVLARVVGADIPSFVGSAIEFGLPSEGATELVANAFLTRPAALAVTRIAGPDWISVRSWISGDIDTAVEELALTTLDRERLMNYRERLILTAG